MNPIDALPEDFGMYYDGCWLRHKNHGIGLIRVIDGEMHLYTNPRTNKTPIKVQPKLLECWWPRAGAFNCGSRAIYVARRTLRNMRKSAISGDHYYVKWGDGRGIPLMEILRDGPNHVSVSEGLRKIERGNQSVAVGRDIIIAQDDLGRSSTNPVYFRGLEVGTLAYGDYIPLFSDSPFTERVRHQLEVL